MTCILCGDKSKKRNKDFTRAVVEINNPEEIVLFRKVTIPASMGDDTTVPPAVGKYKNVLLVYEINNHAYLYSSDGVPTLLTSEVAQEMEEEIQRLSTGKQDKLIAGNKIDITDDTISLVGDSITVLNTSQYDYPSGNINGIALWRLDDGMYYAPKNILVYPAAVNNLQIFGPAYFVKVHVGNQEARIYCVDGGGLHIRFFLVNNSTGACSNTNSFFMRGEDCVDNLNSTLTKAPLSANQGKVLNDKINSITNYSASETDTGATWVDGSKIYKKTINTGALPDTTVSTVTHGITGLNRIIKAEGCAYDTSLSLTITAGVISIGGNDAVIIASNTSVGWLTTKNLSNYTESYVTLYYTKN